VSRSAEQLLEAVLEREWMAQSGATRPLLTTAAVREACELTVSATRRSVLDVAALLPPEVSTPQVLLERMRPLLPTEVDAWAERLLERMLPGDLAPDHRLPEALDARGMPEGELAAVLNVRHEAEHELSAALDTRLTAEDQLPAAPGSRLGGTRPQPLGLPLPGLRLEQVPALPWLLGALLGLLLGVLVSRSRQ
jgi:hypothetical protein